jgi:hypothetical protein
MSQAFRYERLSREDAALLLVDHQAGLISLVQDFSPSEFKNNVHPPLEPHSELPEPDDQLLRAAEVTGVGVRWG